MISAKAQFVNQSPIRFKLIVILAKCPSFYYNDFKCSKTALQNIKKVIKILNRKLNMINIIKF